MSAANKQVLKLLRCVWEELSPKQQQDLKGKHTVKIITYADVVDEATVTK